VYRLEVTKPAQRELNKLGDKELERIVSVIRSLRENPRPKGDLKEAENSGATSIESELAIGALFMLPSIRTNW
jgi:mRNA-degrading endonuclease RelE of RelBE toxin-antitoxin system